MKSPKSKFEIKLESVHKRTVSQKVVIPAKAGIQFLTRKDYGGCLDIEVRHDGKRHL